MISTPVIVLRKTPFSESSLVVATLSPSHGRLDFIVRGAKRCAKKKYPEVDLFRELNVSYRKTNRHLHTLHSVELLKSFDSIAMQIGNYICSTKIADFILRNSHQMLPAKNLYLSLRNILGILARNKEIREPCLAIMKLIYLEENGFLPKSQNSGDPQNSRKIKAINSIINALINNDKIPVFPETYWSSLDSWINDICSFHQIF